MAILNNIKGLNLVLANMQKANINNAGKVNRIVRKATLILGTLSGRQVPVDENNLKPSRFERVHGVGFNTQGRVGYLAKYAIFVHENEEALHGEDYNREYADEIAAGTKDNRGFGQKSKFLSDPMSGMPRNPKFLAAVKMETLR